MPETLDPGCSIGETLTRSGYFKWPKRISTDAPTSSGLAAVALVHAAVLSHDIGHALNDVPPHAFVRLVSDPVGTNRAALHWVILEHIIKHPGVRVEQVAEALDIQDLVAFEVVDELRASGLVGPA